MGLSMYAASAPVLMRALDSLGVVLDKGLAFAQARKIEPSVLLQSRLAPNMLPLTRQVQIATDNAKGAMARLAGQPPPSFPDSETSFEQLLEHVAKVRAYVAGFTAAQIDGSEERLIVLPLPGTELHFKGQDYLLGFVLPNFFFHVTMAYAILRHNGVELGKRDYLGQLPVSPV